jgi:hypothetical protein
MMVEFTLENILLGAICVGVATVAILYFSGKLTMSCSRIRNGYNYDSSGVSINTGCEYLAANIKGNPDEDEINSLCSQYQQTCGNGSASAEIMSLNQGNDTLSDVNNDASFVSALQQDVLAVKLNSSSCAPALPCRPKKMDCPPFLSCKSGACN